MRRLLLLTVLAVLAVPGIAHAATVNDVVADLRRDKVYVDPASGAELDEDRIRNAIGTNPIYVASLPARAAAAQQRGLPELVVRIGQGLGNSQAAVLVLTDDSRFQADEGGAASSRGINAGNAARQAFAGGGGDLNEEQLTARVLDFVRRVQAQAGSRSAGGNGTAFSNEEQNSGSGGGTAVVLGGLGLAAAGGGAFLYSRSRRRRLTELESSRADVESLYNRLGSDVATLSGGDDQVARQALADAAERYNATGALMSQADTPGEFEAARRTAVEGLTAARVARSRLGLDPGPDIPAPPGSGPQLQAAERVKVGDQEYDGSPDYQPGRQHYYGGGTVNGQMVPGGWYAMPFWETMLIGSVLAGGFGGFGGGYGAGGYERGYEEGVEDAGDARQGDGGGWGDGGGGGWGGGGGGWDGGGGGDWGGGGGGDWGGGGGGDGGSW